MNDKERVTEMQKLLEEVLETFSRGNKGFVTVQTKNRVLDKVRNLLQRTKEKELPWVLDLNDDDADTIEYYTPLSKELLPIDHLKRMYTMFSWSLVQRKLNEINYSSKRGF